ncbi:glycoprotein-N-acetylgalactosamine 3-beta-galactosyltransferase, partial [Paragonimus westermani]
NRVNVVESKRTLWQKLKATMKFLYLISDKYDFFFKADDDTYVITDNLYKLLKKMDPDEAFLMGSRYICKWNKTHNVRFFHGGAGYVISRAAIKLLVEKALDKNPRCPRTNGQLEDVKTSEHLRRIGRYQNVSRTLQE